MVKRIGSRQRKTRYKTKHDYRYKGKLSLRKYFQVFKVGDKVSIKLHPMIQEGRCFPRFHGRSGQIVGKKGKCYELSIIDGKKEKTLCVHPIHLKRH